MHWAVALADAIIALRRCKLSGRFEDFWESGTPSSGMILFLTHNRDVRPHVIDGLDPTRVGYRRTEPRA